MSQILLGITLVFSSISVFLFNIQTVKFGETLKSFPISLVSSCVNFDQKTEIYYFIQTKLESLAVSYFELNLKNVAKNIAVGFTYYDSYHKKVYSDTPQEVQIKLMCTLKLNFRYEDSINFSVHDSFLYK